MVWGLSHPVCKAAHHVLWKLWALGPTFRCLVRTKHHFSESAHSAKALGLQPSMPYSGSHGLSFGFGEQASSIDLDHFRLLSLFRGRKGEHLLSIAFFLSGCFSLGGCWLGSNISCSVLGFLGSSRVLRCSVFRIIRTLF